jgi:hypothetical protein
MRWSFWHEQMWRVIYWCFAVLICVVNVSGESFRLRDLRGQSYVVDLDVEDPTVHSQLADSCQQIYGSEADLLQECISSLTCALQQSDTRNALQCHEMYSANKLTDAIQSRNLKHIVKPKYRYSSHTCLGGSQIIDRSLLRRENFRGHFNNTAAGEFRICKFHNVCLIRGQYPTMAYFQDPEMLETLPHDFQLSHFGSEDHLHLGYISYHYHTRYNKSFMPLHLVNEAIPDSQAFLSDDSIVGFLGAHSWPNYGHILVDDMLSTFAAAKQFNIGIHKVQQVFETRCMKMGPLPPHMDSPVFPNMSLQQSCMKDILTINEAVFDRPVTFLDNIDDKGTKLCFRTVITGHGSALGQKAWDLSRGIILRDFRDHVIQRFQRKGLIQVASQVEDNGIFSDPDNLVLVLLKGSGDAANDTKRDSINNVLCLFVTDIIEKHEIKTGTAYRVQCIFPHTMTLAEEVNYSQKARIVVSYHGTVAYSILFVRDETQVILLTENEKSEYGKDFHIFSRATHFHVLWLTMDRVRELPAIMTHAIRLLHV